MYCDRSKWCTNWKFCRNTDCSRRSLGRFTVRGAASSRLLPDTSALLDSSACLIAQLSCWSNSRPMVASTLVSARSFWSRFEKMTSTGATIAAVCRRVQQSNVSLSPQAAATLAQSPSVSRQRTKPTVSTNFVSI